MTANEKQDIKKRGDEIAREIRRSVDRDHAKEGLIRAGIPERYWH